MSALEIAHQYIGRGWNPVPIPHKKKSPVNDDWQKQTITADNVEKHFNGGMQNIGVQLGQKSGGLTDVDLDCSEACILAPFFLPPTPAVFGRASKPRSHYLYSISDPEERATLKLVGADRLTIIELRMGGGEKGAQTVFPGSTHEEGEAIVWSSEGEPPPTTLAVLKAAVAKIAVGAILMRAWPGRTGHNHALVLGGFLARCGWDADAIGSFVKIVAREGGSKHFENSRQAAIDAAESYAQGGRVYGFPAMVEHFGEKEAKAITKIIGSDGDFARDKESGKIIARSQANITKALELLGITVRCDSFQDQMLISGLTGFSLLDDRAMERLWLTIDEQFKFLPPKDFFWIVIADAARRNSFHPVRDYLDALKWDGKRRIDTWLNDYAQAKATKYVAAVGALVLVAAVRRIRQPGCKFDEIVTLESEQGFMKSSALAIMAVQPEWFTDDLPLNANGKEVIERLRGRWIVEAAELKGMRKGEIEHLKSFLSRTVDRARMSYDRLSSELKRQCVFIGTTNHETYLRDETGNRRYWPVKVGKFDIARLTADRDQLWAEAAAREAAGVSIRLDPSLYAAAAVEQKARAVDDPWVDVINSMLRDMEGKILVQDVWKIVGVMEGHRTQEHNSRLGNVMKACGWERTRLRFGERGMQYCYVRPLGKSSLKQILAGQGTMSDVHVRYDGGPWVPDGEPSPISPK